MSVHVTAAVWHHSATDGRTRLVLLALADCANHDAQAWPSVGTLAHMAHVDRRTVQRALAEAVALGELERSENFGGRGHTARYRFLLPVDNVSIKGGTVSPFRDKGRQNRQERAAGLTVKGGTVPPEPLGTVKEPRRDSAAAVVFSPAFAPGQAPPTDPEDVAARVDELRSRLSHPSGDHADD
jgi:hypothetical protein